MIGETVSHYKILDKLGEGGMGLVYRAEDTSLGRTVALKFLPVQVLGSTDDRARFRREAKAAAALNHPNIATIYEISDNEDKPFIAMEYIEGKTLNELLKGDLLKITDVISIVVQIAEGLKAAHAKNIVHRDIKSANIIVSSNGQAKVLDFGLAQTSMSTRLTKAGSTLGTVAYMSPEQVAGHQVDHRTDLWSLGVVLFEMIAGRLPFAGDYDQVIFYNIANAAPEPLTSIRSGIPLSLEWIVGKLLAKNPDERYQNAIDAIIDLKAVDVKSSGFSRISSGAPPAQTTSTPGTRRESAPALRPSRRMTDLFTGAFLFLLGAALTLALTWYLRPEPLVEVRKFQWQGDYNRAVLSPDGKKIAYAKGNQFWIRRIDKIDSVGIVKNQPIWELLWSPNSEYLAYFTDVAGVGHELRRISSSGEGDMLIAATSTPNAYPRFWGTDDSIVINTWDNRGMNTLWKVPISGGELVPIAGGDSSLAKVRGDLTHVAVLPDGKTMLLSIRKQGGLCSIEVQTASERRELFTVIEGWREERPEFSPSGHILFTTNSSVDFSQDLWAVPFDPTSLTVTGKRFLVARDAGEFSVSRNGMLLYTTRPSDIGGQQPVILSRSGDVVRAIGGPQDGFFAPSLSPDGTSMAAVSLNKSLQPTIWIYNLTRGNRYQLNFEVPTAFQPAWSPKNNEVAYESGMGGIYLQSVDGLSPGRLITDSTGNRTPAWSADGRFVIYAKQEMDPVRQFDLWYVKHGTDEPPKRLFGSRFNEDFPTGSPDGKFVAFVSDKTGQAEVYVAEFPNAEHQWQISVDGGTCPEWVGDEIVYVNTQHNALMSAPVDTRHGFRSGMPAMLFSAAKARVSLYAFGAPLFAVHKDGQSIAGVRDLWSYAPRTVLVENWLYELSGKR